jgi:hypothetical protein
MHEELVLQETSSSSSTTMKRRTKTHKDTDNFLVTVYKHPT